MARLPDRDEELSGKPRIRKQLLKLFADVEKGFADQRERADATLDYWDIYNNNLTDRQFYNGTSKIFLPYTHDAVEARKTRFVNQLFPRSGRYVDVTSEDGSMPYASMSLIEDYVRRAKLRTKITPALLVTGDVEGQYSIYVSWRKNVRHVVSRETKPIEVNGVEFPELGEVEMTTEEKLEEGAPDVEIIHDCDLLVLPATVDSIDEAIDVGGSVTVIRRWTKAKLEEMADAGEIDEEQADYLIASMAKKDSPGRPDIKKTLADVAGIKAGSDGKFALVYETWTKLKIGEERRLCRAYYGGDDIILGCKRNPYWCDLVPVISEPVKKAAGVFKGTSLVSDVVDVQVFANDTINEAADTAHFSAMPIIMTDPEKNPRVSSMVLGLAAVWETNPQSTQFAQFPELWRHGVELAGACREQIFQTLGVNPAMIPSSGASKSKRNQAELATEQQVDLLTTADATTVVEEGILTPLLARFMAYDHQFREDDVTVRAYGELGLRAKMEQVPPSQWNKRWEFKWFGVEAARSAAQIQQQIGLINVLKTIPPELLPGYKLNLAPVVENIVETAFGPRLGPKLFQNLQEQLSVDAEQEEELMEVGFAVQVHPMDDDQAHMKTHLMGMREGDPYGVRRAHIQMHQQQMQMKARAQQMQAMQQMMPGQQPQPPQRRQIPGKRGTPPGAMPGQQRVMKLPPGAIHQDRLPGAGGGLPMPRKM